MRWTRWGWVTAVAIVVVGCGGAADSPATSSTTPTTQTFLTSSTTATPNWDQIYRDIERRRHAVFADPTPASLASLDELLDPECNCYAADRAHVQEMIDLGRRSISAGYQVQSVEFVEYVTPSRSRLRIVVRLRDDYEIDRSGTTRRAGPDQPRCQQIVELVLRAGDWRVAEYAKDAADPTPEQCPLT